MTHSAESEFSGGCLCGAIRFFGTWGSDTLRACHCGQCRVWSGHVWAAATPAELTVTGQPRWYRSSDFAERGFCADCGTSLFWRRLGDDLPDVAAGCVETPTGLRLSGHIFVADKGDYYEIMDDLPQEVAE